MKLEEALQIIKDSYPNFRIVNVVDYDNLFVFNIVPPNHDVDRDGEWFGGLVAVDKLFKITMHFNPLDHNPSTYVKAIKENIKWF